MKQPVLFVILEGFGDWEYAFLAAALQQNIQDKTSPYEVKTLSVSKHPVKSFGGFTTLPDYSLEDYPADYAGLVLVGGTSWRSEEAKAIAPLLTAAVNSGKVVGAICDATVFLGMHGVLNEKAHTSNTLEELSAVAGAAYTGRDLYRAEQAVRDGNLITANGTGQLEFCREMLLALDAYPANYVEDNYQFYKLGFLDFMESIKGRA